MFSDDMLDLCNDKLQELTDAELQSIIDTMIMNHWTKNELIDFIEEHFLNDDWTWFYEEYVTGGGVPDV